MAADGSAAGKELPGALRFGECRVELIVQRGQTRRRDDVAEDKVSVLRKRLLQLVKILERVPFCDDFGRKPHRLTDIRHVMLQLWLGQVQPSRPSATGLRPLLWLDC